MGKLLPQSIVIESSCKPYGDLPVGERSSGSTFGVTCLIPPDTVWAEIKKEAFVVKETLDLMALVAELARGSISQERYQAEKNQIKAFYNKILGRANGEPSSEG